MKTVKFLQLTIAKCCILGKIKQSFYWLWILIRDCPIFLKNTYKTAIKIFFSDLTYFDKRNSIEVKCQKSSELRDLVSFDH